MIDGLQEAKHLVWYKNVKHAQALLGDIVSMSWNSQLISGRNYKSNTGDEITINSLSSIILVHCAKFFIFNSALDAWLIICFDVSGLFPHPSVESTLNSSTDRKQITVSSNNRLDKAKFGKNTPWQALHHTWPSKVKQDYIMKRSFSSLWIKCSLIHFSFHLKSNMLKESTDQQVQWQFAPSFPNISSLESDLH